MTVYARSLLLCGMLTVLVILGGCGTMDVKQKDVTSADRAFVEGRFTEAETLYQASLSDNPSDVHILNRLGLLALWRNDLSLAEARFNAALEHSPWLQRRWPFNAQLLTHLAMSHGRAGRIQRASRLLERAAGPLPFGPLKELKLRARQLALFESDSGFFQIAGPAETTVPFVIMEPLPVVEVAINGFPPVNFFIDTGGEDIILDTAYAKTVGAVFAGEVKGEYAGAKSAKTGYGKIDRLNIGELTIDNVAAGFLDLQPISTHSFKDTEVKGIIGTGFLMHFLSTIDYQRKQLVLRRPAQSLEETDRLLDLREDDHVFPMWLVETHLIFAMASVNELAPSLMFIDTGLGGAGFLTSRKIASDAGIDMDWSKVGEGAGGGGMTKGLPVHVDHVTLGMGSTAVHRKNIDGVIFEEDISLFKGALGFQVGGLISHQFFHGFALTFDFVNMRIILQE